MKKIIITMIMVVSIMLVHSNKTYAAYDDGKGSAIGVSYGGFIPYYGGIGLTGKFNNVPLIFTVDLGFNLIFSTFNINIVGEWHGLKPLIGKTENADIYFYLGIGFFLNSIMSTNYEWVSNIYEDPFTMDLGVRVPIGFSFVVNKSWDIFLESGVGINLIGFSVNENDASFRMLGMNANNLDFSKDAILTWLGINAKMGFKYWF